MDMKDLNKSQLILLAILLSFITSIATGITTVTLMQQAPSSVTVPINRVVRQTVEKIQQVEGKTTVQTVVVKEEDLVVDAIGKNQSATFAVSKQVSDSVTDTTMEVSIGRGFAVSADGIVVVDGLLASGEGSYYLKNDSGKFKADFVSKHPEGFSFLKIGESVEGSNKAVFTVPPFGDLSKMKIGQKVILFGGKISSSIFEGNNQINLTVAKGEEAGLVLNLDGEALGVALSDSIKTFASISQISEALKGTNPPQ